MTNTEFNELIPTTLQQPVHQPDLLDEDFDEDDDEDETERTEGITADVRLLDREFRENCFNTADEDEEADLCGVFGADDEANFEED